MDEAKDHREFVFRFSLGVTADDQARHLPEFYRESIVDLLKVVRFFAQGKPVIVDAFAFQHRPDQQIELIVPGRTSR